MNKSFLLIALSTAFVGCEAAPKAPANRVIIKTLKNSTPYSILFVDRLSKNKSKNSIVLPAGETTELNFESNGQNNVSLHGSMAQIMESKAQYAFKKLDEKGAPIPNQEVYLNISLAKGGVDDGSGIITGTPGTTVLKFFAAGKNGGCRMSSGRLQNNNCKSVEFELEIAISDEDIKNKIFRLDVGGEMNEIV